MPYSLRLIFIATVAGAATGSATLSPIRLVPHPSGNAERIFVDSAGRHRIFRGVNAVVKGPPWVPATDSFSSDISLVDKDFEVMAGAGWNVLRLGVMWPGVEPRRGEYNVTYLQELEKIVKVAGMHGIYTILDMHQDGLSEKFCGEGIPQWALSQPNATGSFPLPAMPKPFTDYYDYEGARFPSRQECAKSSWTSYQAARATAAEYEALYKNKNGVGDAWAAMLARVAAHFKGMPEVLGIELINEPFAGDFFVDPLIMVPYPSPLNADRSRLEPAYDRINAAVRKVDNDVLLFFAGVTWDDLGPGFRAAPGGRNFANRSVLAYHYYDPPQRNARSQVIRQREGARRLDTGIFLTETAGGAFDGDFIFDAADEGLQSWASWEFKSFCREDNNSLSGKNQNAAYGSCKTGYGPAPYVYRTFASAVSGVPTYMQFNASDPLRRFELRYIVSTVNSSTQISLSPAKNYPAGFSVHVLPAGVATWKVVGAEAYASTDTSGKTSSVAHQNATDTLSLPPVADYPPKCRQVTKDTCGTDYTNSCLQCESGDYHRYQCLTCCSGCTRLSPGDAPISYCQCGTGPLNRVMVEVTASETTKIGQQITVVVTGKVPHLPRTTEVLI